MNRRLDQLKRRYASWMMLAVFVWVMQPVGTAFFCHDDVSQGHSAHASESQSSGHQHGNGESHDHAASDKDGSTPTQSGASSELPKPASETCCCQPQETPATAVAAVSHAGSDDKAQVASPPVAILPLTYLAEAAPAAASRAGPDVPSLYSQLCRSSFSNRAPPFST